MPSTLAIVGSNPEIPGITLEQQASSPVTPASGNGTVWIESGTGRVMVTQPDTDVRQLPFFAVGTYIGSGGATQSVTILGAPFKPQWVRIVKASSGDVVERFGITGDNAWQNGAAAASDLIISLDDDGFTVGDGGVNWCQGTFTYYYMAMG